MHPIVLVHGFFGYERLFVWRMFDGVAAHLREKGVQVLQPQLHPTASIDQRARELEGSISGAFGERAVVHIVAHSLGGLDSRYLASPGGLNQGHRIRSITTLSTPHFGTPLADRIPRWLTYLASRLAFILTFLPLLEPESQFLRLVAEDNWEALQQLVPEYICEEFNPQIVDSPSTTYNSYAADISTVRPNMVSALRSRFIALSGVFDGPHDGIVPTDSCSWGDLIATLPCDHATIMGLRYVPLLKSPFDHLALFDQICDVLAGLEEIQKGP